jgi:hypothetical protein
VPTLLEVQNALRKSLVDREDAEAAALVAERVPLERLDIYRNGFIAGVTRALRLSYPAVHRLVGDDFFAAAAGVFIARNPPRAGYLHQYGGGFPKFLEQFPSAATLVYLGDVARLEWAVSQAVHAPDREPLELAKLAALADADQVRVWFVPHPSISMLRLGYSADIIRRAVLDRDEAALAGLDLDPLPIHLLVQRLPTRVEVMRLDECEWRFAAALCAGQPLQTAFDGATGVDANVALANHLAAGRFVGFALAAEQSTA